MILHRDYPVYYVEGEFRSGLTWRSLCALLYSLLVFTPVAIYLSLVTIGGGLAGSVVEYSTLLLFSEIAALYGARLLPQEAVIIFGPAATIGFTGFLGLIFNLYFVRSPLLNTFGINPSEIPQWFAPHYTSPVWDMRTFFHIDWLPAITVTIVVHITSLCSGLFFGLLARELFIEGERLPFPIQHIDVVAIISLSERKKSISLLSLLSVASFLYGLVYYAVPLCTKVYHVTLDPIPKPWIDFTTSIESFLPGAAFGIATSLTGIAPGLVIPQESLIIGVFLGSVIRFLIINPLLIRLNLSSWAYYWTPGMNLTRIYQYSQLYFWLNPLIGVGFAVGLVPLIFNFKTFVKSLRAAFEFRKVKISDDRISGPPISGKWMILLFCIGAVGAFILDIILLPDFPLWVFLLYEFIMPFLVTISAGRIYALTGTTAGSLNIPYFYQLTMIASGYPKISCWFLPLRVDPGTGWLRSFKICQLTKTTIESWIKASIIAWVLAFFVGLFYTQFFWQIAPIPSEIYPAPGIQWPIDIISRAVWITRPTQLFDLNTILYWGFGLGALLALSQYLGMSFLIIGMASGLGTPIPVAVLILLGLLIKRILIHFFGDKWFVDNRAALAAGLVLGESLAAVCGVSLAMVLQSSSPGAY
ncbi:MAG: OPT/YSL family transporter [Candidatus Bathyarchaeia archaeon]